MAARSQNPNLNKDSFDSILEVINKRIMVDCINRHLYSAGAVFHHDC